ncbi:2905_t:CDS:2, partial [Acaulospora morrowiae]
QMPTSKEIYKFSGRFYITSSQNKITRFPAPKIVLDESNNISPREYWESLRCQLWNSLSSQSRAAFTWPPSGEIPKSEKDSFKCLKLDSMLNSTNSVNSSEKILHDLAFENFCILIFKANEVMRFDYEAFPPKRIIYNFDDEEDVWEVEEANP